MWRDIYKSISAFERPVNWLILLFGGSLYALTGTFLKFIGEKTTWVSNTGPYGIFLFVTIGLLLITVLFMAAVHLRFLLFKTKISKIWIEGADSVNPIDREFHRKRIRISDIAHPLTSYIANKRFIDFEINVPVILHISPNNNLLGNLFTNCDIVYVRKDRMINTAIIVDGNEFTRCQWYKCTIYVDEDSSAWFKAIPRINFISLTGDSNYDTPPLPALELEKPL